MEPLSSQSPDVFSFQGTFSPSVLRKKLTKATDEELSQRLHFIKEVGCGNWGSVWLCEPKSSEVPASFDAFDRTLKKRVAVKVRLEFRKEYS